MKNMTNNKLPMIMKFQGSYQSYKNGEKQEDIELKGDYDGNDLEVNVNNKIQNKSSYIQLTNDDLIDLMTHDKKETHLEALLEKQLQHNNKQTKTNKRRKNTIKKSSKSSKKSSKSSKKSNKNKTRKNKTTNK